MVMLKGMISIQITFDVSEGQRRRRNTSMNEIHALCFGHRLNFSFTNGKSNRRPVTIDGFNTIVGVYNLHSFYGLRISGGQSVSCVPMIKVNEAIVADVETGLACQEKNVEMRVGQREGEVGTLCYEQNLPPWGNADIDDGNDIEMGRDDPICEPESMVHELDLRLHFLEERDENILSKRILGLSRYNKVTSALELFMSMEASGLQPTPHACNSLLSCLLRNGFLNDAVKVFETLKKEMTSGHTYSLILKAVAGTRGYDSALKMFMDLEKEGTSVKVFDVITYNTVISICGKANNWVQAERIWKTLKENGHKATAVTYNLLVSTFVRCSQMELAFDAYSEMVRSGMKPGEDMMQAIISACTKEGEWRLAYGIFQSMLKCGLIPNVMTYNALINSLGKAGEVELTFKVFGLMRKSGHMPDAYTWNALLGALNRGNRYTDTLRLFESIKSNKGIQLNTYLYNAALMSCQRLGLWDRSVQLLWQMEAGDVPVLTESYNLAIGACEAARKPKVALQVYEQMVHKKCIPDTFTYLSLIRACIWGSLWSEVKEILDHVPPSVSLYNAVIHGMCLQGEISLAKRIYMKMCESGLKPDGKTRALMIQNLRKKPFRRKKRYFSYRHHH